MQFVSIRVEEGEHHHEEYKRKEEALRRFQKKTSKVGEPDDTLNAEYESSRQNLIIIIM